MIKINNDELTALKENLNAVMKHMLDVLREILATIHEERLVLEHDEVHKIHDVLDRRQEQLEVFDECYKDFVVHLHQLTEDLDHEFSLVEGVEWMHKHLEAEDLELLLLCEQLAGAGQEMQRETRTLISFLEYKSAFGSQLSACFTKIDPIPVRVALALALAEEDETFL